MKKGLFTKTVLATFISMTLISTASAELVYRHPIDGAKASSGGIYGGSGSNGGGSDTGAETGTDTENDDAEQQAKSAWEEYALPLDGQFLQNQSIDPEEPDFDWGNIYYSSIPANLPPLPAFPTEIYPVQEIRGDRTELVFLADAGLTALNGFRTASSVGLITLANNDLSNIDGLENVRSFNHIDLRGNPNLTDVSALNNVVDAEDAALYIDSDFRDRAGVVGLAPDSYLCSDVLSYVFKNATQDDVCDYLQ